MTVVKPNIRQQFVPDPGYILIDGDIKGADAQVVAWEADDTAMKDSLRTGISLHVDTATKFYGEKYINAIGNKGDKHTPKGRMYDDIKRATHGTNYGAAPRTIATTLGWPLSEGYRFNQMWLHELHPGIGQWHKRTEKALRETRTVVNKFGYRIMFFDRVDGLLPEALAWSPQSTVAIAAFKGAIAVRKKFKFVQFLIQGHDSNVFQIPIRERNALAEIKSTLEVVVPYDDPMPVKVKLALSSRSWGECAEWKEAVAA